MRDGYRNNPCLDTNSYLTRLHRTGLLLRLEIPGDAGKLLGTDDVSMPADNSVLILDGNISVVSRVIITRSNPDILHAGTTELYPGCGFHVLIVDNNVPGAEPEVGKCPDAGIIQYLVTSKHCRDSDSVPSRDEV